MRLNSGSTKPGSSNCRITGILIVAKQSEHLRKSEGLEWLLLHDEPHVLAKWREAMKQRSGERTDLRDNVTEVR